MGRPSQGTRPRRMEFCPFCIRFIPIGKGGKHAIGYPAVSRDTAKLAVRRTHAFKS